LRYRNFEVPFRAESEESSPAPLSGNVQCGFSAPCVDIVEEAGRDRLPIGVQATVSTTEMGGMTGWSHSEETPLNEPSEEFIKGCCQRIAPGSASDDHKLRSQIRHYLLSDRDY